MTIPQLTERQLIGAYELERDDGIKLLESLGVPHRVAVGVMEWHCETTLLDEYEHLRLKEKEL